MTNIIGGHVCSNGPGRGVHEKPVVKPEPMWVYVSMDIAYIHVELLGAMANQVTAYQGTWAPPPGVGSKVEMLSKCSDCASRQAEHTSCLPTAVQSLIELTVCR